MSNHSSETTIENPASGGETPAIALSPAASSALPTLATVNAPISALPAIPSSLTDLSLAELDQQYQLARKVLEEKQREKERLEFNAMVDKVKGLPAYLGQPDLNAVQALIRKVTLGIPSAALVSKPESKSAGAVIPPANGTISDRERALTAMRNGASQKQIFDAFGYSQAWYYSNKRKLGLSKVYGARKVRKGRFSNAT